MASIVPFQFVPLGEEAATVIVLHLELSHEVGSLEEILILLP
jgi:hypothetical protein